MRSSSTMPVGLLPENVDQVRPSATMTTGFNPGIAGHGDV